MYIGEVLGMSFFMRLESLTHSLSMCIMSLKTYRYFLSSVVTTTANSLDGYTNPEVWSGMPSLFRSRTISDGSSVHSRIGVLEVLGTLGAGYIVETLRTMYSVCGYVTYDMLCQQWWIRDGKECWDGIPHKRVYDCQMNKYYYKILLGTVISRIN